MDGHVESVVFLHKNLFESRVAVHWFKHAQNLKTICVNFNLGMEDRSALDVESLMDAGAASAYTFDLRKPFIRDYCFPVLIAQSGCQPWLLSTSTIVQPLLAYEMVRLAQDNNCRYLAQSFCGRESDRIRFERTVNALDPDIKVIDPSQNGPLADNKKMARYAEKYRMTLGGQAPESRSLNIDRNIWCVSISGSSMEDFWTEPPKDIYQCTQPPMESSESCEMEIGFQGGSPVSLNGEILKPTELVERLNHAAGRHGVGRWDSTREMWAGRKVRDICEAPGATVLFIAHSSLEDCVLSQLTIRNKDKISRSFADLLERGLWFTDLREAMLMFFQRIQKTVTGEVRVRLHHGNCTIIGRRAKHADA